eukprot:766746-Hanusia_phi.AAC.1
MAVVEAMEGGWGEGRLRRRCMLLGTKTQKTSDRRLYYIQGELLHRSFVLREPLWAGMTLRVCLHDRDEPLRGREEEADVTSQPRNNMELDDWDVQWEVGDGSVRCVRDIWKLPASVHLARDGNLSQAALVAEREVMTHVAALPHSSRLLPLVRQRISFLLNAAALEVSDESLDDSIPLLLRAEELTRHSSGKDSCCLCDQERSRRRRTRTCRRTRLRIWTLVNLGDVFRRKGLLASAKRHLQQAIEITIE